MSLSGFLRTLIHPPSLVRSGSGHRSYKYEAGNLAASENYESVVLGGVSVNLMRFEDAMAEIVGRAMVGGPLPLGVASANLDHVKHFGYGNRWEGTLEDQTSVEWLTLLDGAPLVSQAEKITQHPYPRLAGSDLIWPILDSAEERELRVGFLGGTPEAHLLVRNRLADTHPDLLIAGWWAPERRVLADGQTSRRLAAEIAEAAVDILVVCLGKPRQELWISEYGRLTGANVMLAFGAVIDFMAGRVRRAPIVVRKIGMEWTWRLVLEPRRLAARYFIDGPEAYLKLRNHSRATLVPPKNLYLAGKTDPHSQVRIHNARAYGPPSPVSSGREGTPARGTFIPYSQHSDVAVLVVTFNSESDVHGLIESLRQETALQSIKVIVADNSLSPATRAVLDLEADVLAFSTGGNLGYAGGINLAMSRAGSADAYLILNPDMRVEEGAVAALRARMATSDAGVVVPALFDDDGTLYPSVRRDPTLSRAIGDAVMGSRLGRRPGWLSEMDFDPESYLHPHRVDWATGAALLIRADVAEAVGQWDERYFLYSEETDFLLRVRRSGAKVWFEPLARMQHRRGGSGNSPELTALMAVSRVRFAEKFYGRTYALAFRAAVLLSELLRARLPGHRGIMNVVACRSRWTELPHAECFVDPGGMPAGSVIIPAHNEAAVLARTLAPLAPYAAAERIEVIVCCNGCTDTTEQVAKEFEGVTVLRVSAASKAAAMNAGNSAATLWPRLYLDADITIQPEALVALFERLKRGDVEAARPSYSYDVRGAAMVVRAFYRARQRMPSLSTALWGAGAYAVTESGQRRIGDFPTLTADDLYVDRLFPDTDKEILSSVPLKVRVPRTIPALVAVLRRTYRGNSEQGMAYGTTWRTIQELVGSVRGPKSLMDALVYAGVVLGARLSLVCSSWRTSGDSQQGVWERDDSSRRAE